MRIEKQKLSETRATPPKRREEVARSQGTICLGNVSYRKVSSLRRF